MTFELLNIKPEIIKALKEHGIVSPTKIQKLAIPMIKTGQDVIGMSNTGSGKTIAFGIPMLEKAVPGRGLQILILTPTRELAVQITTEMKKYAKYLHCKLATVYGGVSLLPQTKELRDAEIVVGTTGRLVDHLNRGNLNLSKLICLVLDEADKMIEMGFIEDIEYMLSKIPKTRQVILFGATISDEINHIKHKHMKSPLVAKTELQVQEDLLEQYYIEVQPHEKFSLLVHLLKKEDMKRAIVFCPTRHGVDALERNLSRQGIKVEKIHGRLTQSTRLRIIREFNDGDCNILIASAVAARGLDIKGITHIFNYGLSKDPQEYIHRVGRTARAGETGKAITLLEPNEYDIFAQILDRFRVKIEKLPKENFERIAFQAHSRGGDSRGRSNFRGSRFGGSRSGGHSYSGRRFGSDSRRDNRREEPRGNQSVGYGFGQRKPEEIEGRDNRPRRFDGPRRFGNHSSNERSSEGRSENRSEGNRFSSKRRFARKKYNT